MKYRPGPDPEFPYLTENERFRFPDPLSDDFTGENIVAVGGNLSPGMLLSAYEQGLFPWYSEEEPVLWHSPDPRFVLFPEKLHISNSMMKILRQGKFSVHFDRDFAAVIGACSRIKRKGQNGTWITRDMEAAYLELHRLGWAHSAEADSNAGCDSGPEGSASPAGGCYGIRLGNVFFGESMFSLVPNASKAAFITLAQFLFNDGVAFIDCQQHTRYLESLGAEDISRADFLALLRGALSARPTGPGTLADNADRRGSWMKMNR